MRGDGRRVPTSNSGTRVSRRVIQRDGSSVEVSGPVQVVQRHEHGPLIRRHLDQVDDLLDHPEIQLSCRQFSSGHRVLANHPTIPVANSPSILACISADGGTVRLTASLHRRERSARPVAPNVKGDPLSAGFRARR